MKTARDIGNEQIEDMMKADLNQSGVMPVGDRVLVLPDEIVTVSAGGIIIPPKEADKHQVARFSGTLIAVGPDAWKHTVTVVERKANNGKWREMERRTTGYSAPFANVGDRVFFARYNGQAFDGEDGKQYRLLNDEDVMGLLSDAIDLTEFRSREPLGGNK